MVFDITHLRKVRTHLNLTQHQFAQQAGISQSMVAKIEAGKLDPTYSHVLKIEQTIQHLTKKEEKTAKEVMHKGVVSINSQESLSHIIALLSKHSISQIPVIESNSVLGLITESRLLEQTSSDIKTKQAKDIMEESPPLIDELTTIPAIISLLKFFSVILVTGHGKIEGVITKSDILKAII